MSDKEGVQWRSYVTSWIKKLSLPDSVKAGNNEADELVPLGAQLVLLPLCNIAKSLLGLAWFLILTDMC